MNLTLRDIAYFLAVVETGSMARAALAQGVTQPALSKSLKRLESETGITLFQRGTRPLALTSPGLVFLQHARRLHAEYGDAVRNATELRLGTSGLLRIGAAGATLDSIVLPALARMYPRRPAMRVQLQSGLSDHLAAAVAAGRLDLAVTPTYGHLSSKLVQQVVGEERLRVVVAQDHPFVMRQAIALDELAQARWVLPKAGSHARLMLDGVFAEAGVPLPEPALEVDAVSSGVLALLRTNRLVAAVPERILHAVGSVGLAALPVPLADPLRRRTAILTRGASLWSPLMTEFKDSLVQGLRGD